LKGVQLEDLLGAGLVLCSLDGVGTLDEEGKDNFVGVGVRKEIAVLAEVHTGVLSPDVYKHNWDPSHVEADNLQVLQEEGRSLDDEGWQGGLRDLEAHEVGDAAPVARVNSTSEYRGVLDIDLQAGELREEVLGSLQVQAGAVFEQLGNHTAGMVHFPHLVGRGPKQVEGLLPVSSPPESMSVASTQPKNSCRH
jgi:hypothetical protein